jgi:hypothetical protein
MSVVNPGFHQRFAVPLIKATVFSEYCRINYLSEEKKASLEFSPRFGTIPVVLTVHPLENFHSSISFLGTLPAFETVKSDVSVLAKYSSVAKKGKFAAWTHVDTSLFGASVSASATLRDLVSVPLRCLSMTFGTLGTHWGIEARFPPDTRPVLRYLIAHKNSIISLAGKWEPRQRTLKLSLSVALKAMEMDIRRQSNAEGENWSFSGKVKAGGLSVEFRKHSAGRILWIGQWTRPQSTLELWLGCDLSKSWENPLFGAKLILEPVLEKAR